MNIFYCNEENDHKQMITHRPDNLKSSQNYVNASKARLVFIKKFKERFFLRFHMSLILLATILSGLLASKFLLLIQVNNMVVRYPLAVICSYLVFFLFIKLWLWYISIAKPFRSPDAIGNLLSNSPDPSISGTSIGEMPSWGGGLGGRSGGGGASGSFGSPITNNQEGLVPSSSGMENSSGGVADGVGDIVSGVDDDTFIFIVLGVLLTVIFGSSLYLIIVAPHILSDAAFNFLLAASLMKSYKTMNKPEWFGSVFRETYIPFIIVLMTATGAAWLIHARFPQVVKISELIKLFF